MMVSLFHGSIVVLYVAATFGYSLQLIFNDASLGRVAFRIFFLGWLTQTTFLVVQHLPPHHNFTHGEGDLYYTASWIMALALVFVKRMRGLALLLIPILTALALMALTHPRAYHMGDLLVAKGNLPNPWALIHFLFMSLSFAIFAVSFIVGISFLLQRRALKSRRPGWLSRWLPPLEVADDVHAKASTLGFMVLSAGMLSGAILSKQISGVFFSGDLRQIAALLVWLVYALFLNIRVRTGQRGRKGIILSLLGFVVVILAYLAIRHRV